MKVKEEFSDVFKKDEEEETLWLGRTQKVLKEKGKYKLFEQKFVRDKLQYSDYRINDVEGNVCLMSIFIPDPLEKDLYKDIYLKYQVGARTFLKDFFDVLVGDREDIPRMYKLKQKKEFECEISNDWYGTVNLKLIGDGYLFAMIQFPDKEENKRIAEKFVKYFRGIDVSFADEVGLCGQ